MLTAAGGSEGDGGDSAGAKAAEATEDLEVFWGWGWYAS
ncbi:hypothetical protein TIFTF001_001029 [Ficus carica]|uniref:Uncharacterized protein n=1 Tax=Ficus carica TaxID=3494 RepID=A0AA88CQA2_FICCA|nr:hypothetical protein TIFTF001_001029 [Ficus carica]